MSEFPAWWFVVSGIFYGLMILLVIFCIVAIGLLIKTIAKLGAHVGEASKKVQELCTEAETVLKQSKGVLEDTAAPLQRILKNFESVSENLSSISGKISIGFIAGNIIKTLIQHFKPKKK